jgi:Zn-dependent M16 (insulinase) family peptidase
VTLSESEGSSQASQSTITLLFNNQSSNREESFTISHFKRLLLSFIINNNISFRAIITPSFKSLLKYLN